MKSRLRGRRKIVPERIRENQQSDYDALRAADQAWDRGHFNVTIEDYLPGLFKAQAADADVPTSSN